MTIEAISRPETLEHFIFSVSNNKTAPDVDKEQVDNGYKNIFVIARARANGIFMREINESDCKYPYLKYADDHKHEYSVLKELLELMLFEMTHLIAEELAKVDFHIQGAQEAFSEYCLKINSEIPKLLSSYNDRISQRLPTTFPNI